MMPKATANLSRILVNANASTRFGARNRATVRELGQIVRSADPESNTISKSSPQSLWIKSLFHGRKYTHRRTSRTAVHEPASGGSWTAGLGAGLFIFIPAVALVLGILGVIGVSWGVGRNKNRNSHPLIFRQYSLACHRHETGSYQTGEIYHYSKRRPLIQIGVASQMHIAT